MDLLGQLQMLEKLEWHFISVCGHMMDGELAGISLGFCYRGCILKYFSQLIFLVGAELRLFSKCFNVKSKINNGEYSVKV